jgi:hypothetical protein
MVTKGWSVFCNELVFSDKFDIVEKNGYIPNASAWNEEVYKANNLTITGTNNG